MVSSLLKSLLHIIYQGEGNLPDRSLRLSMVVFYCSIYLSFFLSVVVAVIFLGTGHFSLLLKLPVPCLILFSLVIGLARRQYFMLARVSYQIVCMLTLLIGLVIFGKQSHLTLYFINLALFPYLLFRPREWRWTLGFSSLSFLLFNLIEFDVLSLGLHPSPLPAEIYTRFVFIMGAFAGVILPSIVLFWQSNVNFRRVLKRSQVLARDEKFTAIGRLAAGAAHEINNPLAIVKLTLENLDGIADASNDRTVKFRIQKGYDAIQRIQVILQKLQLWSMPLAKPEPLCVFDISQVISQRSSRFLRNRGIPLSIHTELQDHSIVLCHKEYVIDAVDSLILNAMEAMMGLSKPEIAITLKCEDLRFLIQVEDCGPGISEQINRSLFTPFFTTKEIGAGLGLSLYSARCIARQYGGDLTCESGPGGRFFLSLPLQNRL